MLKLLKIIERSRLILAYIYQITNQINGKVYVGKTEHSIEKRFKEHCQDALKERNEKRPLYAAMRKYGTENFQIELLEETDNPEERETFWIEQKRSFKNGYNATLGGDGKKYLDYDLIIATYKEVQNLKEVVKLTNAKDTHYVSKILKNNNIEVTSSAEVNKNKFGKVVNQYKLDGTFLKSYSSAKEAAKALGKITDTSNGASSHITNVCKGKRKSAYGYIWKFG